MLTPFCSVMINIHNRTYGKLLNCVGIHSGPEDQIMLVNIILGRMKLDSSVKEVIMIATMVAFSSIGMLSH